MSQEALGRRAGVSRKWVYEFEGGKPTAEFGLVLKVLEALALELEVAPSAEASGAHDAIDLDALLDEHRRA